MTITYYNTAIKKFSTPTAADTVEQALSDIRLARYGSRGDPYLDDDCWRIVIDGEEYTPSEASKMGE